MAFFVVAALGVSIPAARGQSSTPSQKSSTATHTGGHRAKSRKRYSARERGQKAPAPDRISEIQTALAKDNSFTGKPNGKWDAATVEAMKRFQESHGLNPSGKLDAKTLQKLGLGSQTAGAAPPVPQVSSSSLAGPSSAPSVPHK
jgi:peptidoglycan hydrolase-like protein with peptidoglycan-binding domain